MTRELASPTPSVDNGSVRFGHAAQSLDPRAVDLAPASSLLDGQDALALQRLLDIARELRPRLRAEQQATEDRGHYSLELHQLFWDSGFYRVLQPRSLGGLQLGVAAFYRLIAEIARGCPSTGWCLCLGAGHALQLASYFSPAGQARIFARGQAVTASSGGGQDVLLQEQDGGYRLSGTWRYCSGAPHSTHFMAVARAPQSDVAQAPATWWLVLEREQYEVLDDWGAVTGMRGSGSNSIRVDNAWVAADMIVADPANMRCAGPSPGSLLHGDALYAGAFRGFAEGEIAAVSAGLALAAVDELEQLLTSSPLRGRPGAFKAEHLDYQRAMGLALAAADSASALSLRGGQLYEDCARRSVAGLEAFGADKALRLASLYFCAEQQAWSAVDQVLRAAGSSALQRGKPLERYARDVLTIRSRNDQLDFDASVAGNVYLRSGSLP